MTSLYKNALRLRCPRCGKSKLYAGLLEVADNCPECGLSLKENDAGDGATFFVIVIASFVVMGLAAWMEYTFSPSIWVHVALWTPLTLGLSIFLLRIFKSLLIAQQ